MYVKVDACVSRAQRARTRPMGHVPAWKHEDWKRIMAEERARENARRLMMTGQSSQAVTPVYSAPAMRLMAVMGG